MNLLGLDLGTRKLGFALGGPDRAPKSGVVSLPGADDHTLPRTLSIAAETVASLCRVSGAKCVVIEAPIVIPERSAHTMLSLVQLTGAVRSVVYRAGCSERLVPPQTVRKFFVGHGRPDNPKQAIMERCRLLGWSPEDDNAGDALAAWAWGMATLCPKWAPKSTPLFAGARQCQ